MIEKISASIRRFFAGLKNIKLSVNYIILVIALIAFAIIGVFVWRNQPSAIDRLSDTYLDTIENRRIIKDNIESSYENTYQISDYGIYGENLILFQLPYSPQADNLLGKNVVLRNVETEEEIIYTFDSTIDSGINLGDLEDGLYEIYVYDHYLKKRVFFEDPVYAETFYTIRREGEVKNISLVADADYLKSFDVQTDQNYLYLSVISQIPKVKVIDILIDPSANVYNNYTNTLDTGMGNTRIMEIDESLELAQMVKEHLEAAGLRVNLTRSDNTEVSSYYGNDSRVAKGYDHEAKVFLNISMLNDENERYDRPYFMISPLTKAALANQVAYHMMEEGLELSNAVSEQDLVQGVIYDAYSQEQDGSYTVFSQYPQLRETGGKLTFTGLSDISSGNKAYAQDYGMYGLVFRYCNLASDDSITYYLEHKEEIARALAEGILEFYGIEASIH